MVFFDRDAQLITIHDFGFKKRIFDTHNVRRINPNLLAQCKYNLSFELWEDVFDEKDVNNIFNSSNTLLRLFDFHFPIIKM
jgi:hypothetical protein